jgi:allophanate hydrolase subunit 1
MNRESGLEAGFVVLVIGFLAGFGALVGGRLVGDLERRRRHAELVPPGSVPPERHQQWSASPR